GAGSGQLWNGPDSDGPAILAGRSTHDTHRHDDCVAGHQQRAIDLVCRGVGADGLPYLGDDALSFAAPISVSLGNGLENRHRLLLVAATVGVHAVGLARLLTLLSKAHAIPPARLWPITWLLIRIAWALILIHAVEIT